MTLSKIRRLQRAAHTQRTTRRELRRAAESHNTTVALAFRSALSEPS